MSFEVLLIGAGSVAQRHAMNLRAERPDARFTILRGRPVEDDFTRSLNARVLTGRFEDLDLATFNLAVLASPSADHIATLPQLIASALPILVEKPVVTELADCAAVEAALMAAPPAVRVAAFNMRHLPSLNLLKSLIVAGQLGRIVRASFTAGLWLPDWRPGSDWRAGYAVDGARGGGVTLDLAHEPDLARWLLGELDLVAAAHGSFSSLAIAADDTSIMLLKGQGGGAPLVQISLDYVSRQRRRHCEIVGDLGTALWSVDGQLELVLPGGRQRLETLPTDFDISQSYILMMRRLLAAMEGDWQAPLQSLEEGLISTRLALLARQGGAP